ncbi:MAG: hypothetical protein WC974_06495, partial [Thermoplasmata archaeon]
YKATLTVYDSDGETNSTSFTVTVSGIGGDTYTYVGGIAAVCAVVAVIVLLFYFRPSVFGAGFKLRGSQSPQTPQQTMQPPPPPQPPPQIQQSQYDASYQPYQPYQTQSQQPQQYQPQSIRPPSPVQYPHLTQPTSRVQSDQYGEYSTCPACGETIQIPPSADASPVKVVCPSCGAESIIE